VQNQNVVHNDVSRLNWNRYRTGLSETYTSISCKPLVILYKRQNDAIQKKRTIARQKLEHVGSKLIIPFMRSRYDIETVIESSVCLVKVESNIDGWNVINARRRGIAVPLDRNACCYSILELTGTCGGYGCRKEYLLRDTCKPCCPRLE
jgi:hypothetical protein